MTEVDLRASGQARPRRHRSLPWAMALLLTAPLAVGAQSSDSQRPLIQFDFNDRVAGTTSGVAWEPERGVSYARGIEGQALSIGHAGSPASLTLRPTPIAVGPNHDFSVQFWVRSEAASDQRFLLLAQKDLPDNSLASQKKAGWAFYQSAGTWAWNMGSGTQRVTYERDNGQHMPINDGRWHQLTMTYRSAESTVRLYYDGVNWVTYHVSDANGFEFAGTDEVTLGWNADERSQPRGVLPAIEDGAHLLQRLVDAFNAFELSEVNADELVQLVVDPRLVFEQKVGEAAEARGVDSLSVLAAIDTTHWEQVRQAESDLMANPYTVHQVLYFMETAPLPRIYTLVDGAVTIRLDQAEAYAERERLSAPNFDIDELAFWDRALAPQEVLASYERHTATGPATAAPSEPSVTTSEPSKSTLTVAVWNIWHGGKHFTPEEDGWDSRTAIAEMLGEESADIVLMQETYSSGDFIAAELGYYFATTVDRDYLNQGSNISILSRYPITELHVEESSTFMNVSARITLSETQDIYAMSNWYGMSQFPAVFDFHESRFEESEVVPVLFGGDFNAVPHTDGGDSPASRALLGNGFVDAFRALHPDVEANPGPTHRSGNRIDQLFYKGTGLGNTSTRVISTRPSGFPSDHYLILARFDLDYVTRR